MARRADPAPAGDPSAVTSPASDPVGAQPPATEAARSTRATGSARPSIRRRASADGNVDFVEPRVLPIQKATDLGSVQVLKHGNLYLLTDPFGDIHPDSRGLGLYLSDTRMLSCCSLRVSGTRPVLLQGSMGANYRGSINLTNPSADRNPDDKMHPQTATTPA